MSQKLWVTISPGELAKWGLERMRNGKDADLKIFLREIGASKFQTQTPSFLTMLWQGWVEVPQGSCVKLNLS